MVWRSTGAILDSATEALGRDRGFTVVMESIAGGLCAYVRAEVVVDAFRAMANIMDEVAETDLPWLDSVELIPLPQKTEQFVEDVCQLLLANSVEAIGLDDALSAILSRIARQLRPHVGLKVAKQRFRQVATMLQRAAGP